MGRQKGSWEGERVVGKGKREVEKGNGQLVRGNGSWEGERAVGKEKGQLGRGKGS